MSMQHLYLLIALAPLAGAIVVGLGGSTLGRAASHWICILGVAVSFVGSGIVLRDVLAGLLDPLPVRPEPGRHRERWPRRE